MDKPFKVISFQAWKLDLENRQILGGSGSQIDLTKRELRLLSVFVEHGRRILTREEILNAAWGGTFVEKGNVDKTVSAVRKKFESLGFGFEEIIETVQDGYRFLPTSQESASAPSEELAPLQNLDKSWRKFLILGGALLTVTGIAVVLGLYMHKRAPAAPKTPTSASAVRHLRPFGLDKAKIYLANIQGPDNENYRVTDTLYANLKQLSEKYSDLEVVSFGRSISEQEDLTPVRDELERNRATLLIWGWYNRTKERVHVRLHIEPLFMADLFTSHQLPVTVPLSHLEKLDLSLDLSGRINAISLIVEGVFLVCYQKDYKEAERAFAEAAKEQSVAALMKKNVIAGFFAIAQFQQQKYKEAEKTIKAALSAHLSDEEKMFLYSVAAWTALIQEDYPHAESICDKEIMPRITSGEFNDGEKYTFAWTCSVVKYENGNRKDGDLFIQKAIHYIDSFQPEQLEDYVMQGDWYWSVCAFDSALRLYQTTDKMDPGDPVVLVRIANAFSSKGDFGAADRYFKQAERLDPKNMQAVLDHATAMQRSGDLLQALALYRRAQKINPKFSASYAAEADILSKQGDVKAAIDAIEKAINLDPMNVHLYIRRARLYRDMSQHELEFADYGNASKADTRGGSRGLIARLKARMMLAKGKMAEAGREFDSSVQLDPYPAGFEERGEYHLDRGETSSAIADFTKAIGLYEIQRNRENCLDHVYELNRADHATALFNRGRAFSKQKKFAEALSDAENSYRIDNGAAPHFLAAQALEDMNRNDQAMGEVAEVLKLDAHFADAYNLRGRLHSRKGELQEALSDFNQAVAIDPTAPYFFVNRGNTEQALGMKNEATYDYLRALSLMYGKNRKTE